MKIKNLTLTVLLLVFATNLRSEQNYEFLFDSDKSTISITNPTVENIDFSKPITIALKNKKDNQIIQTDEFAITLNGITVSPPKPATNAYSVVPNINDQSITIVCKYTPKGGSEQSATLTLSKKTIVGEGSNDKTIKDEDIKLFLASKFPEEFAYWSLGYVYSRQKNEAIYILDSKGNLLFEEPRNIDANDKIRVLVICSPLEANQYNINMIGEYKPVYVNIQNHEKVTPDGKASAQNGILNLTVIERVFGPYTSSDITLEIKFSKANNETLLKSYDITVNPLYTGAFGVSLIQSHVENFTYSVTPLNATDNTISRFQSQPTQMITLNYIYYWPFLSNLSDRLFKRNKVERPVSSRVSRMDHLTGGRDVLKEPRNIFERVFPTVGVGLNKDFSKNFFLGFVLEFARGGNFIVGTHLTQKSELALKAPDGSNFIAGQSVFKGTQDDIKTFNKGTYGFFFGITLDTKIFNAFRNL